MWSTLAKNGAFRKGKWVAIMVREPHFFLPAFKRSAIRHHFFCRKMEISWEFEFLAMNFQGPHVPDHPAKRCLNAYVGVVSRYGMAFSSGVTSCTFFRAVPSGKVSGTLAGASVDGGQNHQILILRTRFPKSKPLPNPGKLDGILVLLVECPPFYRTCRLV